MIVGFIPASVFAAESKTEVVGQQLYLGDDLTMHFYVSISDVHKADGVMNAPKLFSVSAPNVICEAVKNAEDIANAYVIRLYECERNLTNCTITLNGAKNVWRTNLLEEKQEELTIENGAVSLTVKPFEIVTLLVER